MTRKSVPLPGLRAIAIAFLLARIAKGQTAYCADLDNKVVDFSACDNNIEQSADTFFMFSSAAENLTLGTIIDPSQIELFDSSDPVERQNILLPLDVISGGTGKGQACGGKTKGGKGKGGTSKGGTTGGATKGGTTGGATKGGATGGTTKGGSTKGGSGRKGRG